MKEIQKVVEKLSRGRYLRPVAAYKPVQKKHKVTPVYQGDLIIMWNWKPNTEDAFCLRYKGVWHFSDTEILAA